MKTEITQQELAQMAQDDARRRVAREAFVKFWVDSLEVRVDNLCGCDPKALAYDAAWQAFRAGRESVVKELFPPSPAASTLPGYKNAPNCQL